MKEQLALLPSLLGAHVRLVVIALVVCSSVSVPLGVLATRSRRVAQLAVGAASVVQTIPALALLAVMVPLLAALGAPAIGTLPALVALTLYSSLPVLMGTITGIREIQPGLVEAARAVGMTERQVTWLVELPLALPYVVAGTRTATVWCVGMATLATPVGAASLGNFIFGGLQTGNRTAIAVGCVAAAGLALCLDGLVLLVERGLVQRRPRVLRLGFSGLAALGLFTVVSLVQSAREDGGSSGRRVRIGAKSFSESYVLGQLLAERVEIAGGRAEVRAALGSTVIFDALASGELDAYVDYSGTLYTTALHHEAPAGSRESLLERIRKELPERHGASVLVALGFENTYCLAVREKDATTRGWRTISDLHRDAPALSIGADYEFLSRGEWSALTNTYGLAFRSQHPMDPTLMYRALHENAVDVITAFSTDGRIAAYRLQCLEDDRHVFPPYDALVLVNDRFARERPEIVQSLRTLENRIDAATMRELNRQVDELHRAPRAVAREFARTASR